MSETFLIAVLAIGSAQGFFLTLGLLLKETANRRATRVLAVLVAMFTLLLVGELAQTLVGRTAVSWILAINIELAIGPLWLLFVRCIFEPNRRWRLGDAVQLLPFAVAVAAWAALSVALRAKGVDASPLQYRTLVAGFAVFKMIFFYAYVIRTVSTLRRELAQKQGLAAGRRRVDLGWLIHWTIGFAAVATVLYALVFVDFCAVGLKIDTDNLASLTLVVMIYLLSLMALLRPWVLSTRPRHRHIGEDSEEAARLVAWLESEQPYLDPELTLRDLAEGLGLAENRLSTVLNDGLGTSFYDLVNRYRLAHFERLAGDKARRERTVLDLAFESGFNSKATFYRVFRRRHGTTPSSYRERLLG